MKLLFFSSDMDMINEWKKRHAVEESAACFDLETLHDELEKTSDYIIIADYDSISSDINKMISSNTLPAKTIVLERTPEIITGKKLISYGIKAYGNSRMTLVHFRQMLTTVTNEKVWTYPELTASMMKTKKDSVLSEESRELVNNRLTGKEIEVLYLALEGFTNDAIASSLGITTRTVKAHVSSIFAKLHVNDRLSLVLLLK
ncbi:LuxR C-terminal-related transcriptional regulator [bacterium]|nr:LuxR C-terminal-related transcriptional regulator [bacterium]MBU1989811.1 LuxR C-terminal-related transcriptional regulator [bacterium]